MFLNYSTKMETVVLMQMKSGLSIKLNEIIELLMFFHRQVMRSLGLNPTNKEITDLIAEVDKNGKMKKEIFCSILSRISLGNQRLDFQEFVAFMSKHWHERDQEAELREAFRLFDRDNSGYITINELKQVEIIPLNRLFFRRGLFFFQGYAQYG